MTHMPSLTLSFGLSRMARPLAPAVLSLVAALTLMLGVAPEASAQADLPTAESLFEAHVVAIGGREAIAKHRNRVVYGTIENSAGEVQILIVTQAAPNLLRFTAQSPGRFTIVRVFDGTTAWGIEMNGSTRLIESDSDEAKDLAFNAVFEAEAAYKTQYTSMRTTERTIFDNRPVFAVDVETRVGLSQRIFFGLESKLIIGKTQVVGTGGTPTELVFNYDEYTDYEGVKLVSLQRQTLRGQVNIIKTDFVEVNVEELPDFSPPASLTVSAGG